MSQAVKKALPGRRPEEQETSVAFRSHYLFESRFCNPREAREKGLVENLVGYARRSWTATSPDCGSGCRTVQRHWNFSKSWSYASPIP